MVKCRLLSACFHFHLYERFYQNIPECIVIIIRKMIGYCVDQVVTLVSEKIVPYFWGFVYDMARIDTCRDTAAEHAVCDWYLTNRISLWTKRNRVRTQTAETVSHLGCLIFERVWCWSECWFEALKTEYEQLQTEYTERVGGSAGGIEVAERESVR